MIIQEIKASNDIKRNRVILTNSQLPSTTIDKATLLFILDKLAIRNGNTYHTESDDIIEWVLPIELDIAIIVEVCHRCEAKIEDIIVKPMNIYVTN